MTAIEHLGSDTAVIEDDNTVRQCRLARLDGLALLEKPADHRSPKRIDCYRLVEHRGAAFKLDPERVVYSLRWLHKGGPPDLDLALNEPGAEHWVGAANLTLLGALRRRAPHAVDWSGMPDIVSVLDAFEAAREMRGASR